MHCSVPTLARICAALGVSADVLLGQFEEGEDGGERRIKWTADAPSETPEIRRLARRLRRANSATLRLVVVLVKELERQ